MKEQDERNMTACVIPVDETRTLEMLLLKTENRLLRRRSRNGEQMVSVVTINECLCYVK